MEKHTVHKDESNKILSAKELKIFHINCDSGRHDVSLDQVNINAQLRCVEENNNLAYVLVLFQRFRHGPHSYV